MSVTRPVTDDPNIRIGRHTYVGGQPFTCQRYTHEGTITIGAFCSISAHVAVFSGGEHYTSTVSTHPLEDMLLRGGGRAYQPGRHYKLGREHTKIGNDVWLGYGARVLGGSQIGDGAIIGAGVVVRGVVEPYEILAGTHGEVAKRFRFRPHVREALVRIKWWDWPDELILARIDDFYGEIEAFVKKYDPDGNNKAPFGQTGFGI